MGNKLKEENLNAVLSSSKVGELGSAKEQSLEDKASSLAGRHVKPTHDSYGNPLRDYYTKYRDYHTRDARMPSSSNWKT